MNQKQAQLGNNIPGTINKAMATADTEYSQALPIGTRRVTFKLATVGAVLKYAFSSAKLASDPITLQPGQSRTIKDIFAKTASSVTIFVSASANTQVLEIEYWQ